MVGKAMAIDLSEKYRVTSADKDNSALESLSGKPEIKTLLLDVTNKTALASAVRDSDLVISAVPGFLGFETVKEIIGLKKDLVDISFIPEDVMFLDSMARKNNVTAVTDCGVAPGMPNYITGFHNQTMKIDEMEYMVGGLPKIRSLPFEYKAPFSPCDVIEEYTRPARLVQNGRIIIKPALSDPEYVNFEKIGTLEAFNTDGLRSLIHTMKHIPFMKEKTLRYPGHVDIIKTLIDAGFFSRKPVNLNGVEVTPFDLSSKVLINAWRYEQDEPEFTVMRVILRGTKKGEKKEIIYDLYDESDPVKKISSMARTTGFTATATAEMILNGLFTEKGLFPPELVGCHPGNFEFIMDYLKGRDIHFRITEKDQDNI